MLNFMLILHANISIDEPNNINLDDGIVFHFSILTSSNTTSNFSTIRKLTNITAK